MVRQRLLPIGHESSALSGQHAVAACVCRPGLPGCIMGASVCCLWSCNLVVAVLRSSEVEPNTLPAGIIGAMDVDDNG